MPKMNPEEVARLAATVLIDLTEEETKQFASELDAITEAFAHVTDAVSPATPPTSYPLPLTNVWREDVVGEVLPTDVILAAAPESEDGSFAVPQILGEDA